MKAVFISFYQAFYEEVIQILDNQGVRGFTSWNEVHGRGSHTGEPHYGSHAWPTLNGAIISFVEDDKVAPLLEALHQLDISAEQQGLRAFVLHAEKGV
jgi:hypothetical protein